MILVRLSTHLHGDHAGSNHIFRGKQLLIRENEIKPQSVSELQQAYIAPMEIREIREDTKIADDVWIIEIQSHTSGSITVMADIPQGLIAVTGNP